MVGHFKMYGEAVYIKLFGSQRGIRANPLEPPPPPLLPAYGPEYAGILNSNSNQQIVFYQLQNDDIGNTKISYRRHEMVTRLKTSHTELLLRHLREEEKI